jgi:hypothetical protein
MRSSPILLLAGVASLCGALLPAQVVLDHFPGTSIDTGTWTRIGSRANLSVGNSRLRFIGPPNGKHFGIVSLDAFQGDFDFILEFENFLTTATNGNTEIKLTVVEAEGPISQMGELQVKLSGRSQGFSFDCNAEKNNVSYGKASTPTTASAAELRLIRTQQLVSAAFRPRGVKSWITLKSWPNFLGRLVYVEIDGETAQDGSSSVECDKISYTGLRVASPVNYGSSCHGLEARSWSIPYYGNQHFGIHVNGTSALSGAPTLLLLGIGPFKKLNLALAPWGAPGCTLNLVFDLAQVGPILDQEGAGVSYVPIPNYAGLVGLPFYGQFVGSAPLNAMNLIWSNGVDVAIVKP